MSTVTFRAFDVVYHAHGPRPLLARLYLPTSAPPFAGVVGGTTAGAVTVVNVNG